MRRLFPLIAACATLAVLATAMPSAAGEAPAYLAVGDSLAFGVGASEPMTGGYVALTHDALRKSERYRDRGLDLVNLGVPGATSSDLLLLGGQLEQAVNEIHSREEDMSSADDNVEIVTIDIGGNDILALSTAGSPCLADPLDSECQDRLQEMLSALEDNLTEVLSRLREAAPNAAIIVLDRYSTYSGRGGAADQISDLAINEINAVTQTVVSNPDLGAQLASVHTLFRGRADQLIGDDGIHANDAGHALIGEVVLAAIDGREPVLSEDLMEPQAVEDARQSPLGEGGLQPVMVEDDEGSNLPVLLAIAIPAALLGAGAIAGAYRAARGR